MLIRTSGNKIKKKNKKRNLETKSLRKTKKTQNKFRPVRRRDFQSATTRF